MDGYLQHHGILGQKWGVRRYQNEDGSLTEAGKNRYSGAKANWKGPDTFKYRRMNRLADKGDALRAKGETITDNFSKSFNRKLSVTVLGLAAANYLDYTNQVVAINAGKYVATLDGNAVRIGAVAIASIIGHRNYTKRAAINASYMRDRGTKAKPNWAGKSHYILRD